MEGTNKNILTKNGILLVDAHYGMSKRTLDYGRCSEERMAQLARCNADYREFEHGADPNMAGLTNPLTARRRLEKIAERLESEMPHMRVGFIRDLKEMIEDADKDDHVFIYYDEETNAVLSHDSHENLFRVAIRKKRVTRNTVWRDIRDAYRNAGRALMQPYVLKMEETVRRYGEVDAYGLRFDEQELDEMREYFTYDALSHLRYKQDGTTIHIAAMRGPKRKRLSDAWLPLPACTVPYSRGDEKETRSRANNIVKAIAKKTTLRLRHVIKDGHLTKSERLTKDECRILEHMARLDPPATSMLLDLTDGR